MKKRNLDVQLREVAFTGLHCAWMAPCCPLELNGTMTTSFFPLALFQSRRLIPPYCLQLTVRRCRPCLKSLIPANLLSMHSRPPHWAITPAILYTSSSSSSSSGEGKPSRHRGKGEDGHKTDSPLLGW